MTDLNNFYNNVDIIGLKFYCHKEKYKKYLVLHSSVFFKLFIYNPSSDYSAVVLYIYIYIYIFFFCTVYILFSSILHIKFGDKFISYENLLHSCFYRDMYIAE